MQPAAHYSAAIAVLTEVLTGSPAEKALLNWSRNARFAGSKDRATVRDIVFDALRRRDSFGARFGLTPRGLVLGRAWHEGDLGLFDGEGHAPAPLDGAERAAVERAPFFNNIAQEFDFPAFITDEIAAYYGDKAMPLMAALRDRAPVDLRVNQLKTHRQEALNLLARDHVFTEIPFAEIPGASDYDAALRVVENPRRLAQSRAFDYGYVELQDLSSQLIADMAGAEAGMRVLDYCAGGGGKTLALGMAMENEGRLQAWDLNADRMKDLPKRAARAGLAVEILPHEPREMQDLVFIDAPCSGSGAWRRSPDGKWRFTEARLGALVNIQAEILANASGLVAPGGRLVYATCSILPRENRRQVERFLRNRRDFELSTEMELNPLNAGDGFYGAMMIRKCAV